VGQDKIVSESKAKPSPLESIPRVVANISTPSLPPVSKQKETVVAQTTVPPLSAEKADPRAEVSTAIQDMITRLKADDLASVVANYDIHFVRGDDIPPGGKEMLVQIMTAQSSNLLEVLQSLATLTPTLGQDLNTEGTVDYATYEITDPVTGKTISFKLMNINGHWCYDLNFLVQLERETQYPGLR
jgi:hypothetical protein